MPNTPKFLDSEEIALYIQNCPDSLDMLDLLNSLKMSNHFEPAQFTEIAEMLEICPMHSCAIEICIDDEIADCAEFH